MKTVFRVDGGKSIGMGHVIRCLSLASAFRNAGHDVSFIGRFPLGINIIKAAGFHQNVLPYDPADEASGVCGYHYGYKSKLMHEAGLTARILESDGYDLLVIDSYNVTEEYFTYLGKYVRKTAYIDDINVFPYPVDILINGNISAGDMGYVQCGKNQLMLLGPEYNMIREEFRDLPARAGILRKDVGSVMITTGGSDPFGLCPKIAGLLRRNSAGSDIRIGIVAGSGFTDTEQLRKMAGSDGKTVIHENPASISAIMLSSDIAISAGGSTLYELCACGTPTIAFVMADNQKPIVDGLSKLGCVVSAGYYDRLDDNLPRKFETLACDYGRRRDLAGNGQNIIDARGSERIVERIEKFICDHP